MNNIVKDLNEQQLEAVKHDRGPLLIIAGAGTGKTTVITKRIQFLILEKKVPASNILALTFTEKAAAEMETRIDQALPYGYTQMWIETFHAFCDRILRQEAVHIGLAPNFELLKEAESLLFLRKHLFEFELDYFRPLGNPMKFLQGMLRHFSRLKDDDISPEEYLEYAAKSEKLRAKSEKDGDEARKTMELARAFKKYEELKAKEGVMDFSDLISNTLKLLRRRKSILTYYQQLFQYILVDEFQDTNYSQNEMSILLAGAKQNITVVADDDQSIYRWRGAAISNVMQFRSHFPKAKIVTLTKNYRSTQNVLDSAYRMIQANNPDRLEVKEGINKKLIAMREAVIARRNDEAISKNNGIAELPSGARNDNDVEFVYTNRGEDEAEEVAKRIRDEVKANKRNYSDFAILVRANDHATPFQRSLERMRIPYQFLGPGHLFQQEEIKDLIAYLHGLANFEDTSSLYRVITLPIFDIEARDVASLLNFAKRKNYSLFEAMEQVGESGLTENGRVKIVKIVEMMKRHLAKIPRETAGQILYYFFEDSGLLGYYLDPRSVRTEREAQNVAKFFDKLQSYASSHTDASVFAIVDWIDLSMELGESPLSAEIDWTRNNAVNILTVHSSKGLEFPFVFVVNLVTSRFPSRDRREQIPVPTDIIREVLPTGDENLQEERRLFYVAITRAKDQLVLCASRLYGDGRRERKISPFVVETLGEEFVKSVVQKQIVQPAGQQLTLLDFFNTNMNAANVEKDKPIEPAKTPITYISYSQLQTFLMCPLHYKLRYILNVPTKPSPALSYGVSVHSTLRDFSLAMRNDKSVKPEIMKELLKKNWVSLGYSSKSHERQTYEQAEKMLLEFAKKTIYEKPDTIAIELPFNFWLNSPTKNHSTGSGPMAGSPLRQDFAGRAGLKVGGRIDRIDRLSDGRIEIIDYKTGANVPTEKKVKEDFQLTFYALAATEIKDNILSKTPEQIVLTLDYLEENKRLSTTRTKEELEQAKLRIFELVDEIARSDFHCSGGMLCKSCEYKMVCQSFGN